MSDIRQQLLAAFEVEHKEHLEAVRRLLAAGGDLKDAFRRVHSLKGAARAVDMPVIEELAHRLETIFLLAIDGDGEFDRETIKAIEFGLDAVEGQAAALRLGRKAPSAEAALSALGERLGMSPATAIVAKAELAPAPESDAETVTYLRIEAGQIEALSAAALTLSAELQSHASLRANLRRIHADARDLGRLWDRVRTGGAAQSLEFDLALRGLLRELGAFTQRKARADWALDQQARAVREQSERLVLTPAEEVFGGLAGMTRELAREADVDVEVRVEGLDVLADRGMLQALKDPVMHLLRNAVSHGVEPAKARKAQGKPAATTIGLRVATRGDRLEFIVHDDGPGPDLEKIAAVAAERGLIGPGPHTPEQLLALVFEQGFSTAETVDRLSGRGAGLSVVAEAARRLHGSVQMRAGEQWGAEVVISTPFSAARQTVTLVDSGDAVYAIPAAGVERLLRLRRGEVEMLEGRPSVRITIAGEDVVVPLVPLPALIDLTSTPLPVEADAVKALLIHSGGRRLAVAVDALRDVRSMLVGETPGALLDPTLVTGGVVLEDDTPALVLDPEALIRRWTESGRPTVMAADAAAAAADAAVARTILVVDDSFTTRTLEKSILEAQGYRVVLSVDGLDALDKLRSGAEIIDLVVADVEMPRMDGFSLLQAIKADAALSALPVILMTSRQDPEDVRRGLTLGAGAYITKQKFDQRELLATIGQLL
ncbi:hybrid sensor histidine kinase/response regulator [Caulobacter sp. NIBR2454]|uniref:hybrid sensor histidine kinase/response regulator n=1 Tax=Caulobacter sp. NIBR2454 TaxID=3015996 RepID=UPI0022B73FBE|nr:response regulator [Caulobacter sp. NIBR2454]